MKEKLEGTKPRRRDRAEHAPPSPGLLVAYAPKGALQGDRFPTNGSGSVGRVRASTVCARDSSVSRSHLQFYVRGGRAYVEDYNSTNGTYVDGCKVAGQAEMGEGAVIRAGGLLLVFHHDLGPFLAEPEPDTHGIVGRFHAARLVEEIEEAVHSGRNLLVTGPSGCGKELAARAVAELAGRPLTVQNAARFASDQEAKTSLFGVGPKVFSDVKEREGYIAEAHGGVLFLDEAHVLPEPVQKALLRVIEDGRLSRIGETKEREVDVRFVLATNDPGPSRGLAPDLYNRLREVSIPPLSRRRADIPSIFLHLLARELDRAGLDLDAEDLLNEYHHEALILDGFERDNVRGLADVAERIATRIASGAEPGVAVKEVYARRYAAEYPSSPRGDLSAETPRTTYEVPLPSYADDEAMALVAAAYERNGGIAAAIKRDLARQGHELSERRIRRLLDEMGLPRLKR